MLSKAKIKYIKLLQLKKKRLQEKLFLVEGEKSVLEFINSKFTTAIVYGTKKFAEDNANIFRQNKVEFELAEASELSQAGFLASNNSAIALIKIPEPLPLQITVNEWTIVLDSINDPGNLGTIIRIADWYGIKQIAVSNNSVDVYNPKVVTASKGSISRVQVHYGDLANILANYKGTIVGASMQGQDVHSFKAAKAGVLVMGSESHGISPKLQKLLTNKITIPKIGGAESLNVGVATAIICDNLIGQQIAL